MEFAGVIGHEAWTLLGVLARETTRAKIGPLAHADHDPASADPRHVRVDGVAVKAVPIALPSVARRRRRPRPLPEDGTRHDESGPRSQIRAALDAPCTGSGYILLTR